MDAKLRAYCSNDFQNSVYWGGANPYQNYIYLNVELARPAADVFIDSTENQLKDRVILFQRQRLTQSFYLLVRKHLVDFFSRLGISDTIELTFLATGQTFTLKDLEFEDEGDAADVLAVGRFFFNVESATGRDCEETTYEIAP